MNCSSNISCTEDDSGAAFCLPAEVVNDYNKTKLFCETKFGSNRGCTLVYHGKKSGQFRKVFTCNGCNDFILFLRKDEAKNSKIWRICKNSSVLKHNTTDDKGFFRPLYLTTLF